MSISYHYITNRNPSVDNKPPQPNEPKVFAQSSNIQPIQDTNNPVYNFKPDFFQKYQRLETLDLAQLVPYVSLKAVDLNGEILEDYNVQFFNKAVDMEKVHSDTRYANRPVMSFKDISISTTQASGYMYFTNVTLNIKIHRQEAFNGTLLAFLFPGMPLQLEYGWSTSDELIGKKELLLFSIVTYDISFDVSGQADLTVSGKAFNDRFNNIHIGDRFEEISNSEKSSEVEQGSIMYHEQKTKKQIQYLKKSKERPDSNPHSIDLVSATAQEYSTIEQRTRGPMRARFKEKMDELANKKFKLNDRDFLTFHDIVDTLCTETFNSMQGRIFPSAPNANYRFLYGSFNTDSGDGIQEESIADFPINYKKFITKINERTKNFGVMTISAFFNILLNNFINNENYWKENLSDSIDVLDTPDVIMNFSNYRVGDQKYIDISVIDSSKDIPITTKQINSLKKDYASLAEIQDVVVGDTGIPVLKLGHANSFIKDLSLSYVTDETLKSLFINQIYETTTTQSREYKTRFQQTATKPGSGSPLRLPLEGELSVLGHIDWKPFRSFYLSTKNPLIDAVYKITSVTHTISKETFSSQISIFYH